MNKIYVGNLPQQTTEDALKEAIKAFFGIHGEIKSIQLPKDRYSGELRGFGFVEFTTPKEAETALADLNGKSFQGNKLKVSVAKEPERRTGGGGGGGGHERRRW